MAKKTLGYGFRLANESFEKAIHLYYGGGYLPSRKAVEKEIKDARKAGDISKKAKATIFKVTVETQE